MSFFDDDDEPRRSSARPPRPRPATPGAPPGEDRLVVRRRLVAIGAIVVVVLLFGLALRGCLSSRKERSLKAYNRNVAALVHESDTQVGRPFFRALSTRDPGASPLDVQTQVNQLEANSEILVKRGRKLDVPDEMKGAQQNVILTLDLRRAALGSIAEKLPTALGKQGADAAVASIAGQMQVLLASDVIYSVRVVPLIQRALDDANIRGQPIAKSRFLPDPLTWLDKEQVAQKLGAGGGGSSSTGGKPAPGLHGHELDSVSVGDLTLEEGGANRIPASANVAFDVKFTNGGENDERNFTVRIEITGAGRPVKVEKRGVSTTAGQETDVTIPLAQAPPIDRPVTIKVAVAPVPGEQNKDNNTKSYPAVFTR